MERIKQEQSGDYSVQIATISGGTVNIHMDGLTEHKYRDIIAHLEDISLKLQNNSPLCSTLALSQNSFWRNLNSSLWTYFKKSKTLKVVLEKCGGLKFWNKTYITKTLKYILNNLYNEVLLCVSLDSSVDCESSERKIKCAVYEFTNAETYQQKKEADSFVSYILHCVREHIDAEEKIDYVPYIITKTNLSIKEEIKAQYSKLLSAIAYENSFAQHINEICVSKRAVNNPLHYLSSQVRFYGREEEISLLHKFVNDKSVFSFSVITGDGGSGKSKLVDTRN